MEKVVQRKRTLLLETTKEEAETPERILERRHLSGVPHPKRQGVGQNDNRKGRRQGAMQVRGKNVVGPCDDMHRVEGRETHDEPATR